MDKDILAIGVWDSTLDLFENQYPVPQGISYNSYLIEDDKVALIDTTDHRTAEQWRSNLTAMGLEPDYLIVQHLEPDHSSQIEWVMERFPHCQLVCTATAKRMLPLMADAEKFADRIITVGDGDTLSLGRHELHFVTAPMVHWPEVMMVYDDTSRTLFSADAFGRFGNPAPAEPWTDEGRRYYYNIVGKYGTAVQTLFKKLPSEITVIAPLHGPVLEGDLTSYLSLYQTWSTYGVETPGVLIAYASIHGMTAKAAKLLATYIPCAEVIDLCRTDMSEAVERAFLYDKMVCMAATYDGDIFPPMHDFIHRLALKGFSHRTVALVENGLWAPAAARKMAELFSHMKDITILEPTITLRGRLTPATESVLRTLAKALN